MMGEALGLAYVVYKVLFMFLMALEKGCLYISKKECCIVFVKIIIVLCYVGYIVFTAARIALKMHLSPMYQTFFRYATIFLSATAVVFFTGHFGEEEVGETIEIKPGQEKKTKEGEREPIMKRNNNETNDKETSA